jgi:hypothetical protein
MCYQKCIILLCSFRVYAHNTVPSLKETEATCIKISFYLNFFPGFRKKISYKDTVVFMFVMHICL